MDTEGVEPQGPRTGKYSSAIMSGWSSYCYSDENKVTETLLEQSRADLELIVGEHAIEESTNRRRSMQILFVGDQESGIRLVIFIYSRGAVSYDMSTGGGGGGSVQTMYTLEPLVKPLTES